MTAKWVIGCSALSLLTAQLPACGFTAPEGMAFAGWDTGNGIAQPGDTITLLQNVTEFVELRGGKQVMLDLDGKTLTGGLDVYDADITVKNGTVSGTVYANGSATDEAYGHVTIASGAIVEAFSDKKRTLFDFKSKITTLADISIYTEEGEMKLQQVFEKLHEVLGDAEAPTSKAAPEELKALFAKAVPDYDADRFYVSHMKKVVDWYNEIKRFASLEFTDPEVAEEETPAEEA